MANITRLNNFNNINKIGLDELSPQIQLMLDYATGNNDALKKIHPEATKVENVGGGKIKINDIEATVYTHPSTHPATMISGLNKIATSGKYSDLTGAPTALPASDVYNWAKSETKPTYSAAEVKALGVNLKGVANGVAELDSVGRLPVDQLPDNLYGLAQNGVIDAGAVPVIDITEKLVDNPDNSMIMGGLDSSSII